MKPTVAVCSLFRNSAETLPAYRAAFESQVGDFDLFFSLVEGDSSDETWDLLRSWQSEDDRVLLTKHDVEPVVDFDDRVRKWAMLANVFMEQASRRPFDHLLVCESDLCVPPDLVAGLLENGGDVVAPSVFLGDLFYDTWGFRGLDGRRFTNLAPYHPDFRFNDVVELSSVGSTVLFSKAVLDAGIRMRGTYENGLLVGMCQDARARGFRVWLDSRFSVIHPTRGWRLQQYTLGEVVFEGPGVAGCPPSRLAEVERRLREAPELLLGCPVVEEDDSIFGEWLKILAEALPGVECHLRSDLSSEVGKTFRLFVRAESPGASTVRRPPASPRPPERRLRHPSLGLERLEAVRGLLGDPLVAARALATNGALADDPVNKPALDRYMEEALLQRDGRFEIRLALRALAQALRPRSYLEIGTRRGWSLAQVLAGAPEVDAFCVDMWMEDYGEVANPGPAFVREEMRRAVPEHRGRLHFLSGNSHDVLPIFLGLVEADASDPEEAALARLGEARPVLFDLVTVDGDHTALGTWWDLMDVLPMVALGGAVVMDDLADTADEVLGDTARTRFPGLRPPCPVTRPSLLQVWREAVRAVPGFEVIENLAGRPPLAVAVRVS